MRSPIHQPEPTSPALVPFIGWSHAAQRFRELAVASVPGRLRSVLLLGETGAGKRTMARAWRRLAGVGSDELPTIDLDCEPARFPCIGVTTRPLPRAIHCRRLDTGSLAACPENDIVGAEPQPPLPGDVADRFGERLYMTPLRRRPIDLLALLHFYNRCVLPMRFGRSYHGISTALIYSMFFQWDWPANVHSLTSYLLDAAAKDLGAPRQGEPAEKRLALRLRSFNRLFYPGMPRSLDGPSHHRWGSEEDLIPFEELPEAAVWIYRWRWWQAGEPGDDRPDETGEYPEATDPLGLEAVFGHFQHGASPFAGATEAATGQEPGACRANQSSPEAFGRLALEEFVAEQLFPGLPFDKGAPHGSPGPGMNRLLDRVRRFSAFGATFDSLQAGLAVQIDAASHEEVELGRGVVKPDRASSNHPSEQAGALLALEGIRGGRKRNVVARIVGSGRFQGIDARIGRVGLLFVSLLFRSCREEVMDDERWTVVEHGEVVDEWRGWIGRQRLKLGGRDRRAPANRLTKHWHRFLEQMKREGRLGDLFQEFPAAGPGSSASACAVGKTELHPQSGRPPRRCSC